MALGSISAGIDPAGAVDWQVLYRLSETLRVSDNIQLRPEAEGPGLSFNTVAGLTVTGRTPTVTWRNTGNIGHLMFFGEGIPEQRERTRMSASSNLLKRTRSTDYRLSAHFSQAPATRTVFTDPRFPDPEFPDLDIPDPVFPDPVFPDPVFPDPITEDPEIPDPEFPDPVLPVPDLTDIELELLNFDQISYRVRGGLVHRRTTTDVFSLGGSASRTDFTGDAADTATPRTNLLMSGGWARRLTPNVRGRAYASVRYLSTDDDEELQRLIYDIGLSSNIQATRGLSAAFNASALITDVIGEDVTVGFRGGLRLAYTYSPRRDTSMTFSVSQRVTSSGGEGELRTPQSANANVSYRINEWSSMDLSGSFSSTSAVGLGGDARQAWRVSPSYRITLARDWYLALRYQWIKTDDAQSNSAFLTLSHNGAILP